MVHLRRVLRALCFLSLTGLLASCQTDSSTTTVTGSADKEAIEWPGPLVDPDFLQTVNDAYQNVAFGTISVTLDLKNGDLRVVYPETWPLDRFIIFTLPPNPRGSGFCTFEVEYPKAISAGQPVPVIPGDVTLYRFRNLPNLWRLRVDLPPAPWYPSNQLDTFCNAYQMYVDENGGLAAANLQTFVGGEQRLNSPAFFLSPLLTTDKPDNPAIWLLDKDEPGEPGSPGG